MIKRIDRHSTRLGASPFTLQSTKNLAMLLGHRGKYEAAERMNQLALKRREKALGNEYPDTLTSIHNSDYLHYQQKRYKGAEVLCQRACARCQIIFGVNHSTTTACYRRYSSTIEGQEPQQVLMIWIIAEASGQNIVEIDDRTYPPVPCRDL